MRARAAGLLIAMLMTAGSAARAQTDTMDVGAKAALFNAVFSPDAPSPSTAALTPLADRAAAATGGVFEASAPATADGARLLASDSPIAGQGLAVWRSRDIMLPANAPGAVDSVRVALGGVAYAPGGVVLARPDAFLGTDNKVFDVRYTRGWPAALRLSAGRYDIDLSPHAGLGVSSEGGSAEAGAMVRFGADLQDRVIHELNSLGLRTVSSESLRDRGRWYLFAAASGQEVGLNMARDPQGHFQRLGWSAEGASELISDAQAGVAWRKGDTQASLGYVHREIHADFGGTVPSGRVSDSMVAFSFSIHPH